MPWRLRELCGVFRGLEGLIMVHGSLSVFLGFIGVYRANRGLELIEIETQRLYRNPNLESGAQD